MSEEKRNLTHPILGVRSFPKSQADAIMALGKANGGWEEEEANETNSSTTPKEKGQKVKDANTTRNTKGGSKKAKASEEE